MGSQGDNAPGMKFRPLDLNQHNWYSGKDISRITTELA